MESSRRDIFIDMDVDRFIFTNIQITLYPWFTFLPKTGVGWDFLKQGWVFATKKTLNWYGFQNMSFPKTWSIIPVKNIESSYQKQVVILLWNIYEPPQIW